MKKRVVVGLSGGVDSSVAAYLLVKQGYEVIGVFMKNWHNESVTRSKTCPWLDDSTDALIVAQHLGIPFQNLDLSDAYKKQVIDYMFAAYQNGYTPNPDILCNREIKFSVFLDAAMKLGADFIATGHYCRKGTIIRGGKPIYQLLAGKDQDKDQSYFLCQLTQNQLAKTLFPLGNLTKPAVRNIARQTGLLTAEKKDSQGLCFVGKVRLPEFLQQQLKPRRGKVINLPPDAPTFQQKKDEKDPLSMTLPYDLRTEEGEMVGEHNGAHYYTIGQRKGLRIGGHPTPFFVIGIDTKENVLYTGQGVDHPGLYRKGVFISYQDEHWIRFDMRPQNGEGKKFNARIRYRQPLEPCTLFKKKEGIYLLFDNPQRGIAPGQFAAWYDRDELIGSGVMS